MKTKVITSQALGYLRWKECGGTGDIVNSDKIISEYDDILESFVYEKIWSEMPPKEREIAGYL